MRYHWQQPTECSSFVSWYLHTCFTPIFEYEWAADPQLGRDHYHRTSFELKAIFTVHKCVKGWDWCNISYIIEFVFRRSPRVVLRVVANKVRPESVGVYTLQNAITWLYSWFLLHRITLVAHWYHILYWTLSIVLYKSYNTCDIKKTRWTQRWGTTFSTWSIDKLL